MHNHELHALLGELTIATQAKIGRLRWAGHVARMHEDCPVRLLFDRVVHPDGGTGRRAGAQRARWGDQVRAEYKENLQPRRLASCSSTPSDME